MILFYFENNCILLKICFSSQETLVDTSVFPIFGHKSFHPLNQDSIQKESPKWNHS